MVSSLKQCLRLLPSAASAAVRASARRTRCPPAAQPARAHSGTVPDRSEPRNSIPCATATKCQSPAVVPTIARMGDATTHASVELALQMLMASQGLSPVQRSAQHSACLFR